ncbi:unnamed protein product [Cyprideis torosa]|uniref:peptidylprolyl isomerase n=1 Tax=Cyprideis torosa TaxID=163714 RepID=A0A7R8W8C9_9CRUS|nr:unnamed protein product [Cyprideis torosa]CAG0883638.1 unnamed protein product [Cyprideis torosa]
MMNSSISHSPLPVETFSLITGAGLPQGEIEIAVGDCDVCPGMDLVLAGISIGKESKVQISPVQAFGSIGLPEYGIAPHSEVAYCVKLLEPLVVAYASAEEYDLVKLADALTSDGVYKKVQLADDAAEDVLHVVAAYTVTDEPREVFFFREGTSIFWNVDELEQCNILSVLEPFENGPYNRDLVRDEREVMPYLYQDKLPRTFVRQDTVHLTTRHLDREEPSDNIQLDKFAVSNALSSSVKLGMWEAILDAYVEDVEDVTKELKEGSGVHLTRRDALKKMGELFAIRHGVNLSSDLLDTPDFYWEREALETLYNQLASCLSIPKRTKVLNEKLSHCCEMMELVLAELSDKKHVRLEWLIIILIAVEIFIEVGRLIVGH